MPKYSKEELEKVLPDCRSFSEVLRLFDLRTTGGNHKTLQTWISRWGLSIAHFETPRDRALRTLVHLCPAKPISDYLVVGPIRYSHLKKRLYDEGLKARECEFCGQGEYWRGSYMGLILDHINGNPNDNRLQNLRILCPNCNSTLDTHCGRNISKSKDPLWRSKPRPGARRVARPSLTELRALVEEKGYSATGRIYGVSDNAIRKWMKEPQDSE